MPVLIDLQGCQADVATAHSIPPLVARGTAGHNRGHARQDGIALLSAPTGRALRRRLEWVVERKAWERRARGQTAGLAPIATCGYGRPKSTYCRRLHAITRRLAADILG